MKRRTNNPEHSSAKSKLFEDDFFIPVSGELFSDIQDGKLTPMEFCVYSMLLRQADFDTGIWTGSAHWVYVGWGRQLNRRTVQHCLKQLADKGLIKSFHQRGQRNDYAVAIHNYRVRFGKWRGYKLDASATTNPREGVYRRDSEATAIPECGDSEVTAEPRRKHSELSANPIARNTPEHPDVPDRKNEQEVERTSTTSTTAEPTPFNGQMRPNADVVAAGTCSNTSKPHDQGHESLQGRLDQRRFMGAVRKIWKRHRSNMHAFQATDVHGRAAMEAAADVGEKVFLAAWDYWLLTCGLELTVKTGDVPPKLEFRTWPLDYFVGSGALDAHADGVRPFAGLAEDETLGFLVFAQQRTTVPIIITPENVALIGDFLSWHCQDHLEERYDGQPMDEFVQKVVVPLGVELDREEKLRQEAREARVRDATTLNEPTTQPGNSSGDSPGAVEIEKTT